MSGRIMISAGETSGDGLGAGLARALRERRPDIQLTGMGGPRMAEAGVEIVQDASEVAVVGIFEVLGRLPVLRRAMSRLEGELRRAPDLLVPVDFPDFNLRLSRRARKAGVPVVYFVSPQVWAWRPSRVELIRDLVRRILVLFPFETSFYDEAGVPVSFVGHPLGEKRFDGAAAEELRARAGLDPSRRIVALMPGSRRMELERHLPILCDAARMLQRNYSDLQFLVTLAPGLCESDAWSHARGIAPEDLVIHAGDFPEILTGCTAGVVAAGTASLEAAVTGLPLVVIYRVHPLTHWIGRRMVRLENVALPNLVAGRRVLPELIQAECSADRIAEELARYLDDRELADRTRTELALVHEKLGGPGVFDRAAEAVLQELDAH